MTTEQLGGWTALIGAVANLLWPFIAIVALFVFRGPIMRTLGKVSESGGTIKVFGAEITVGKATEEQQALIIDLQAQVGTIQKQMAVGSTTKVFDPAPEISDSSRAITHAPLGQAWAAPLPTASVDAVASARRSAPRLLWVDDVPDNNLLLVASLRNRGFLIEQVLSTDAALASFGSEKYDAVISDMGRGKERTAGVQLTMALRKRDTRVPILIFCSKRGVTLFRKQALDAGANVITDSATLIMQALLDLQLPE